MVIAAPGVNLLFPTGRICIVPDATNPGGGTFEANLHRKTATFDVAINTTAVFGNTTLGSFPTHGALFIGLLIGVILILGGLQYFPALALGPIVEHFSMLAGGLF